MNYYMDFDPHLIGQRNEETLAEVRSVRLEEALRHNKGEQERKEKTMVRSAVSKVMLAGRASVFIVALAVALVLGVATTALAASVVDQQNLTHDGFIGAANNQQLAQSFTAGVSGTLEKVSVYGLVLGNVAPGDLLVEIQSVDGSGLPSGTVLGSGSVPSTNFIPSDVAGYDPADWIDIPLTQAAEVSAGTQYALIVKSTMDEVASGDEGDGDNGIYYIGDTGGDLYPAGRLAVKGQYSGGLFTFIREDLDLAFKTYVSPNVLYDFEGFYSPVDNPEVATNKAKAGVAIPVKFSLGGDMGLDIFEEGYPNSQQIPNPQESLDGIEQTVTAGSSGLSYDPTTGLYTYVWKTEKGWAGQYRELVLRFADGTIKRANFNFTK